MSRACGICGTPAPKPFLAPSPEYAPDLDFRPGEPTRSTLANWLLTCDGCGAVAPDLTALPESAAAIVGGVPFRTLRATPPEAAPFLRWAMLCPPDERGAAQLQAAWAADDAGEDASAFRRDAAAAWGEPANAESALRLIDILRRAGAFDAAAARAVALAASSLDENSARIVAFQRARIAVGDSSRYLISSALRPPARMPHVAHGRTPSHGFWSRMVKRS